MLTRSVSALLNRGLSRNYTVTKDQINDAPEDDPNRDYDSDDYDAELGVYYVAIIE